MLRYYIRILPIGLSVVCCILGALRCTPDTCTVSMETTDFYTSAGCVQAAQVLFHDGRTNETSLTSVAATACDAGQSPTMPVFQLSPPGPGDDLTVIFECVDGGQDTAKVTYTVDAGCFIPSATMITLCASDAGDGG
jgi:hypothetical protein